MKHFELPVDRDTVLTFNLDGTGDADIYLRKNAAPTLDEYDKRPYIDGSDEDGTIEVKKGDVLHVMVHGYSEADFNLEIKEKTGE